MVATLRFQGSAFLTYPQFAAADVVIDLLVVKNVLLAQLNHLVRSGKIKSFDRGVVARELHSDGNQHLHVYLHAEMGQREVKILHADLDLPSDLDHPVGSAAVRHGNYQPCRSDQAVMQYCVKEGDYIWWGADPKERSEARGKKRKMLLASLVSGDVSLESAVLTDASLILNYDKLSRNLLQFRAATRSRPSGTAPRLIYLQGPSGVGKTTLAKSLQPAEETYLVPLPSKPGNPWWFDGYCGQRCLVFDNVSKETVPPYDLLCLMVDVSTCKIPVKGGHVSCSPSVIVITSVLEPSQLWGSLWDVQMKRRMTDLWVATTTSSLMGTSAMEMANGVSGRVDVSWTRMDLAPWKVLALPKATQTLSTILQKSMMESVNFPTVVDASWSDRMPSSPAADSLFAGDGVVALPSTPMIKSTGGGMIDSQEHLLDDLDAIFGPQ